MPALFSRSPPVSLRFHGGRHLGETSDVASGNQTWKLALRGLDVRLRRLEPVLEAVFHDALKLRINFLGCPADTLRVLCHLEPGDGDPTSVGCFTYTRECRRHLLYWTEEPTNLTNLSECGSLRTWCIPNRIALLALAVVLKDVNGLWGTSHVTALRDELGPVLDQCFRLVPGYFVLRRTW